MYEVTITEKGRQILESIAGGSRTSTVQGPQVAGYAQRDNKFLCGACGSPLGQHPEKDRGMAWMCTSCGQVYVDACLTMLKRLGSPRTTCTGSNCAAARRKTHLSSVLRKMGTW